MRKDTKTDSLHLLTDGVDWVQSEMLQELFRQENIPLLVKDIGSGGILKIYTGYSILGDSFYVCRQDYERAKELLHALQQSGDAALQDAQTNAFDDADLFEESEAEQRDSQQKGDRSRSIFGGIGIVVVAVLLCWWGLGL